jgi:hypothetical protein
MTPWYRVFGSAAAVIEPAALLEHLGQAGLEATGNFHGDEQGWFRAELAAADTALQLERYLSSEEGIRSELNAWAAWLETTGDGLPQQRLMRQLIGTSQLFTWQSPQDSSSVRLSTVLSCFLAQQTGGIYQVDGEGFFDADGTLLLQE